MAKYPKNVATNRQYAMMYTRLRGNVSARKPENGRMLSTAIV